MAKTINLTIDDVPVSAPEGTLLVNAAKMAGIDIPVFCYHPKMEPVGMCRMCLVEIGRPVVDRTSGQPVLEADGSPKISFGPKLEIACATPISEGMVVRNLSEKAKAGRNDIIEFLLTSHPLDCPICDKGGECPLQNLTMGHGPGESRFLLQNKMHLAKRKPLGELIYLDRERCIQCGRCVRFQDEIVDDPVIGFYQRGRSLEIISYSEPGFDSYFSGNTTDICPVGALTTADFRFEARPWELKGAASICNQCPVGCNTLFNTRREAVSGGQWVIKRVMPRQNEQVNEIWMCDKGRFGYHYAATRTGRLTQPLVRQDGELHPVTWEEALRRAADIFKLAGSGLLTLAGGRLSNEDLYNLKQLSDGQGGQSALYSQMAGGDLTAQVGLGQGSNFSEMGPETAILVVASDLQEEAPIWFLRIKQAADRGAKLIVVNPRATKLDRYATHSLRYPYGAEAGMLLALVNALSAKRPDLPESVQTVARSPEVQAAAQAFSEATNAVILFGSEGTGLAASQALAQACANLLIATNHVGRPNNGLVGVWERANDQGAWDMGFRPAGDLKAALQAAKAAYMVAADPVGDGLISADELTEGSRFVVVQELFMTATAQMADVVLPVQAFTEREGTYTSGERRVQRFYPAIPERPNSFADFAITGRIGQMLGLDLETKFATKVFNRIAAAVSDYAGLSYAKLSEVIEQWPIVGRGDMYYGGTTYENSQGLGVQLQPAAQRGAPVALSWAPPPAWDFPQDSLIAVPITRLYDQGTTLLPSDLLHQRMVKAYVAISSEEADPLNIVDGAPVALEINGVSCLAKASVVAGLPPRVVLVPRSVGLPIFGPAPIRLRLAEPVAGPKA